MQGTPHILHVVHTIIIAFHQNTLIQRTELVRVFCSTIVQDGFTLKIGSIQWKDSLGDSTQ